MPLKTRVALVGRALVAPPVVEGVAVTLILVLIQKQPVFERLIKASSSW
jgi:hypothetical protein